MQQLTAPTDEKQQPKAAAGAGASTPTTFSDVSLDEIAHGSALSADSAVRVHVPRTSVVGAEPIPALPSPKPLTLNGNGHSNGHSNALAAVSATGAGAGGVKPPAGRTHLECMQHLSEAYRASEFHAQIEAEIKAPVDAVKMPPNATDKFNTTFRWQLNLALQRQMLLMWRDKVCAALCCAVLCCGCAVAVM